MGAVGGKTIPFSTNTSRTVQNLEEVATGWVNEFAYLATSLEAVLILSRFANMKEGMQKDKFIANGKIGATI